MAINVPKLDGSVSSPTQSSGGGLGKIVGLAELVGGIASGNPMLIAGGGGALAGGTPIGQAASTVSKIGGAAKGIDKSLDAATSSSTDSGASDAMQRRMQNSMDSTDMPNAAVHQGLQLANDPSLPLDYDTRMAVIEPLLRAKHFGYGGGLDSQNA